jgi:two-component system sensor histidine kinase AtoS
LPLEEKFISATLFLVGVIMLMLLGGTLSVLSRQLMYDREALFLTTVALQIATAVAYISLIFVQWFLLRRLVISPVREFLSASREIADGNLKRRVSIESGDEMGTLAVTFNEMTEKLAGLIASLSELKQFNEEILQSMGSGVIVVRNDSTVATVNSAAERILGVCAGESLGKLLEQVEMDERLRDIILDALRYRKTVRRIEIRVGRKDGRKVDLGVGVSNLLDGAGWFKGIIVLFTDLTETKRLQRDVELTRQSAALGELTAGVVHELRNPLAAISGMAELLLREMDGQSLQKQRLAHILEEVSLLDQTVSRFLAFARPFELDLKEVDCGAVVRRALALCSPRISGKRIRVTTFLDDGVKPIRADFDKLTQALMNLLNNAADAAPDGGSVRIAISSGYSEVLEQQETVFWISDNGPGVREEDADNIFKPFFTQKDDGTGLGLAIVHRIVTAHGGTIKLENGRGQGATFRIALPVVSASD